MGQLRGQGHRRPRPSCLTGATGRPRRRPRPSSLTGGVGRPRRHPSSCSVEGQRTRRGGPLPRTIASPGASNRWILCSRSECTTLARRRELHATGSRGGRRRPFAPSVAAYTVLQSAVSSSASASPGAGFARPSARPRRRDPPRARESRPARTTRTRRRAIAGSAPGGGRKRPPGFGRAPRRGGGGPPRGARGRREAAGGASTPRGPRGVGPPARGRGDWRRGGAEGRRGPALAPPRGSFPPSSVSLGRTPSVKDRRGEARKGRDRPPDRAPAGGGAGGPGRAPACHCCPCPS